MFVNITWLGQFLQILLVLICNKLVLSYIKQETSK